MSTDLLHEETQNLFPLLPLTNDDLHHQKPCFFIEGFTIYKLRLLAFAMVQSASWGKVSLWKQTALHIRLTVINVQAECQHYLI